MKSMQLQIQLPGVPQAKQGREVAPQWEWTEEVVWTERMLETLERGIKGGKWYSLMDTDSDPDEEPKTRYDVSIDFSSKGNTGW